MWEREGTFLVEGEGGRGEHILDEREGRGWDAQLVTWKRFGYNPPTLHRKIVFEVRTLDQALQFTLILIYNIML